MRKFPLFILLSLVFGQAYAVHIGDVTIKTIRVFDDGALVETNQSMNLPSCATNDRFFFLPLSENFSSGRKLSVLLTAQAQQKIFNPNCSSCETKYQSWLGIVTKCQEVSIQ